MNELLELAIAAHGGMERWNRTKSITVAFNFYGALLDLKGYPGHRLLTAQLDTKEPRVTFLNLMPTRDRFFFTRDRVWIERLDGTITEDRRSPRDAFAGHKRETPWDHLHLLYFIGYAIWNYLTAPFLFTRDGFTVRELDGITENGEDLRVLEVHFPPDIPAHTAVQKWYFDKTGILKRIDYTTDVLGGVAAHYTFDEKNVDGIIIPQLRRVVRRTDEDAHVLGPTSFVLDFTNVEIEDQ
jgi:hypothetical protein